MQKIKSENGFDNPISFENLQRIGVLDREPELEMQALNDQMELITNSIETQTPNQFAQFGLPDLIVINYSISLSLTGHSLAKSLSPQSFVETRKEDDSVIWG